MYRKSEQDVSSEGLLHDVARVDGQMARPNSHIGIFNGALRTLT